MAGYRELARNRDFTVLWVGDTASELGTRLTLFTFPLVTFAVTGSAVAASWVESLYLLGTVAALLPAGVLVDRVHRGRVMRTTSLVGAALFGTLALAGVLDALTLLHLTAVALVAGLAAGLYEPAQVSALRSVVSDEELPVALSQNQARTHVAGLIGGPLGGALFSLARWLPFAVDAVTYLAVWFTVGRIRTPLAAAGGPDRDVGSWWADLVAGIRFIMGRAFFRVLLVWAALVNLVANAALFVLILRMVKNDEPPVAIGTVTLAMAAGGIIGSIVAPRVIERAPTGLLAVSVSWWCALPMVPLIWFDEPWVVALCMFGVLLLNPIGNSGISAYRMAITPPEMQGRASSASRFLVMALMPLSPLVGGYLLEHFGGHVAMTALVVATFALALLLTCSRSVRTVPRPDRWRTLVDADVSG
ncbi:MAG: MFS transporter [Nocardioides sp.]|uniref:MFS transporter n=1 Tax=Nocardioides sp. TaxID=35761 RepID=UPI003F0EDA60